MTLPGFFQNNRIIYKSNSFTNHKIIIFILCDFRFNDLAFLLGNFYYVNED